MLRFILNNIAIQTSLHGGMTLLDFIRYHRNLTGTKIGCREGDCGACTVLLGELKYDELLYSSVTSCLVALGSIHGKHIVTVEGINPEQLTVVQQAFSDAGATQCGFCTPGFVVAMTGFCVSSTVPSYDRAIESINGNICRCTGYKSIERAAAVVNERLQMRNNQDVLQYAVDNNMVPSYFLGIKDRLQRIPQASSQLTTTARKLGGGTDLYVQQHDAMTNGSIDFLMDKPSLKGIIKNGNECEMGGAVTARDIADSPIFKNHFSHIDKVIKLISSSPIRNMGTVAGNFTNASPIGDFSIFFLALNASLLLSDRENKRIVRLREFYKGYKVLNKTEDEIIEKITFTLPQKTDLFNFEKVSKRTHLDIASVNSAVFLSMDDITIADAGLSAGGVGPVPLYLAQTSEYLKGKRISADLIRNVLAIAQTEITPISDARGSEAYKRLLLSQLIKAHFINLFPSLPLEQILTA